MNQERVTLVQQGLVVVVWSMEKIKQGCLNLKPLKTEEIYFGQSMSMRP